MNYIDVSILSFSCRFYFKQERIHEEEILKCVHDGVSYPETLNVIEDILHAEGQKLKSLAALYYKGIILMEME